MKKNFRGQSCDLINRQRFKLSKGNSKWFNFSGFAFSFNSVINTPFLHNDSFLIKGFQIQLDNEKKYPTTTVIALTKYFVRRIEK